MKELALLPLTHEDVRGQAGVLGLEQRTVLALQLAHFFPAHAECGRRLHASQLIRGLWLFLYWCADLLVLLGLLVLFWLGLGLRRALAGESLSASL